MIIIKSQIYRFQFQIQKQRHLLFHLKKTKKITFFNETTQKDQEFYIYDYFEHLKRVGFTWKNDTIGFTYKITIDGNKLKKILTLNLGARALLVTDHSRIWNMRSTWEKSGKPYENSRISYIDSYLYNFRDMILRALNRAIHTDIDLARLTREQKVNGLFEYSRRKHIPNLGGKFFLLTYYNYALVFIKTKIDVINFF